MRASISLRNRKGPSSRFALSLLLAAVLCADVAAQTEERAILTVYVNGVGYGDREATVVDEDVHLPFAFLETAFKPILDESSYALVEKVAKADGFLSTADLRFLGFRVELDREALSLRLRAPASFMALGYLGGARSRPSLKVPSIDPSTFSAFANASLRAEQNVGEGFDPYLTLSGNLDGAVNLFGWVAESAVEAESSPIWRGASFPFAADLGYARVVRDFRGIASRLTVGIGDLPWKGLQSRFETLGVSLTRNSDAAYPLFAPRVERRTVGEAFTVDESARVSVRLNGNTVYSDRVAAGRYRFADLPFASGLNEVEVEIAEDGKQPVRYRLGVPFDSGALRSGEIDYGVGAGVDTEEYAAPVASGFFSWGLSDYLTIGASSQIGYDIWSGAFVFSAATPMGLFALESAAAFDGQPDADATFGYAFDASYRFSLAHRRYAPRIGVRGTWRSPAFSPPVPDPTVREHPQWSVSLQAAQGTPVGLSFSLSGEYGCDGASTEADFLCSFGITAPLGNGATLQTNATLNDRTGSLEPSLSFALIVIPENGAGPLLIRREIVSGESNVDLSLSRGKGAGALAVSLGAENLVGPEDRPAYLSGGIRRTGTFSDVYASFGARDERETDGKSAFFSVGADAALVFADGILAATRKVSDSVALLAPDASLSAADVELRLGTEQTVVRAGGKPRAAGQLSSYRDVVVDLDTPGSPPEVAVRETRVRLRPTYKSALVVRPERVASAYVRGRLLDGKGTPRAWLAGAVEDSSGTVVAELFTDETGAFEAYELDAGSYTIRWGAPDVAATSFEVPPRAFGEIELGTVGGTE